ncbi:MAG: cysteine--tRNA ligase [bacterium]|nr:cysteine--tRNA ligase [bacterium]
MLKLYNTFSKNVENFDPISKDGFVRIYSCGMTVQDTPHIGHMRALITVDILRRVLKLSGYSLFSVYNFTDIDDKLITKMGESHIDYRIISQRNIDEFFEVFNNLNILPFDVYPRATGHIEEIIELISKLLEKGFAYRSGDDIYFSVSKFKEYGKLSGKRLDDLIEGKRVEVNQNKENPLDFVLWKGARDNEPYWYSPFGKGRPGWHIECSAMSMKYLGESFDIHAGGKDLIFPHHENEIAQSECATGKPFAKYWIHNGMVNLKGEKMSKSLGNVFKAKELLKLYGPNVLRFFLYKTHYRKDIEFSKERVEEAKTAFKRLVPYISENFEEDNIEVDIYKDFKNALEDDLNTPEALGIIFETVNMINKKEKEENLLKNTLCRMYKDLGFIFVKKEKDDLTEQLVEVLLKIRESMKKEKNYQMADLIREELKKRKIVINDLKDGVTWKIED